MSPLAELAERELHSASDHIVFLDGVTWQDYERFLEIRGDRSAPRMTYLEGVLEIMAPSRHHESIKSRIGRLVEVYCLHAGIDFETLGSWTVKEQQEERGVEPDECYIFGGEDRSRPHLAIEVEWTPGRLDKLEVYRKLGVAEVWYWRRGTISVFVLRGEHYVPADRSGLLPGIDLDELASFLEHPTTSQAIRAYRDRLASRGQGTR
jgi:Uma2 family endonuclease